MRPAGRLLVTAGMLLAAALPAAADEDGETFTVALTGKYPPFSFYDASGELAGFDVDISREIARRLDRPLEIIPTEWDGILAGLLTGKYDAIIGSMAVTPERAERVHFSMPYYVSGAQLFVHTESADEIKGIEDCAGRGVGVGLGETYEHYLEKYHGEVDVVTYKSTVDIFQDVENKRIVGFVTDKLVGAWQTKKADKPFVAAGDLLYTERMAIPVTKDRTELLRRINAALAEMESDGTRERLFETWFGLAAGAAEAEAEGMPASVIARKLAKGFAVTLTIAVASIGLGFALAIPGGLLLNRGRGPAYVVTRTVVDFIRGTPVLIQLFFVYFGGPQVGLSLSPIASAIVTLSINAAAYMSEVVRSGLMSVDRGQKLAGRALGLSQLEVFVLVVWPQAFRIAMPPLVNSIVALTKDTALVSVISVAEVVRQAQSIISVTFNPIKYYLIVAVMFFVVTWPLMKLAGRLEARIKQKGFAQ